MYETRDEMVALQSLLDASLAGATSHLRSIVVPGRRSLSAEQLVAVTGGMCTLALATVTAHGEPRVAGIDGHFLHGRWIVGTDRSAAKARHIAVRPQVSASHLRGEALGVFVHGRAVELTEADPTWSATVEHLTAHYGESPLGWGDVVYWRIEPRWMVGFCPDPEDLAAACA